MGEGPIARPHQPPDSGFQGPGARPNALSCRRPHLGWFSVAVRRLEGAHATGLACCDAYSRPLTRSSLRSPRGPGVPSSSLPLVGRLYNGRVAALCCVPGYGRWRAWRTVVSPTHGTSFPSPPLYAWLVWGWPACVCSVFCRVVLSAAVWLAHGCVSRLMVGLFVVCPIALQPRRRGRMLSLLSCRLVLRFVVASLSDVAVIVLQQGCALRVVLVGRHRSRQWSACLGLCGGPYGLGWPRLVAVGRPLRCLSPVGCGLSWLVRLWRVRVGGCCVVASTMLRWFCWLALVFAA